MLPSLPVLLTESEDGDLDSLKDEQVAKPKGQREEHGLKRKFQEVSDQKDNEDEITALMKASSTIKAPKLVKGKKPPQIRHLEKTLNCLLSDNEELQDEKSFAFAQAYFLKVTEKLVGKDDAIYQDFLKTLNDFGQTIFNVPELYQKITKILSNYPELSEEFLAFLLPEQAMACGKFMEYLMITKMKAFCRKLELYYAKQPMQLRKIFSSLSTLAANKNATVKDVRDALLPLLRNNSFLINTLLELMPPNAPHASSFSHFESMDFPGPERPLELFETVAIPPPAEDTFGGPQCVCSCHASESKEPKELADPKDSKASKDPKNLKDLKDLKDLKEGRGDTHCVSCGAKFIQGRIYFQSGKMLHPAKVSFREMGAAERLSAKVIRSCQQMLNRQNKKGGASKNDAVSSSGAGGRGQSGKSPKRGKAKGKAPEQAKKKARKPAQSKGKVVNKKGQKSAPKEAKQAKSRVKPRSTKKDAPPGKGTGKDTYKEVTLKASEQLTISPRAARWSGRNNALRRAEASARESCNPPVVVCEERVTNNLECEMNISPCTTVAEKSDTVCELDVDSVKQSIVNLSAKENQENLKEVVDSVEQRTVCLENVGNITDKESADVVQEKDTGDVGGEEEDGNMVHEEDVKNTVDEEDFEKVVGEKEPGNAVNEEGSETVTTGGNTEVMADDEDTENTADEEDTENVIGEDTEIVDGGEDTEIAGEEDAEIAGEEDAEIAEGEEDEEEEVEIAEGEEDTEIAGEEDAEIAEGEDPENTADEEDTENIMDEEEAGNAADEEDAENVLDEDSANVVVMEMKNDVASQVQESGVEAAPTSSDSHCGVVKNDINISDDSSADYQDDGTGENSNTPFPLPEGANDVTGEVVNRCKRKRESMSEDETAASNACDSDDTPSDASAGTDKEEDGEGMEIDVECSEEEMEESSIVPPKDYLRDGSSAREDLDESTSASWTREEDKIILQTFQTELISEHVFQKICELLPHRTLEEVQSRFETLMSFLKNMAGD